MRPSSMRIESRALGETAHLRGSRSSTAANLADVLQINLVLPLTRWGGSKACADAGWVRNFGERVRFGLGKIGVLQLLAERQIVRENRGESILQIEIRHNANIP